MASDAGGKEPDWDVRAEGTVALGVGEADSIAREISGHNL